MDSFFRKCKFLLAMFALLVVGLTSVSAQTTVVPPTGLTISGWSVNDGTASGYTTGGNGAGTVTTMSDGFFQLDSDSFLTSNSNPNCTVDCSSTQATLSVVGQQIMAARSLNQGTGTQAAPVTSRINSRGNFSASLGITWLNTPPPPASAP